MNKAELRSKAKSYFVGNTYPHEPPKDDLRAFLGRIDFDILENIFKWQLRRAGLDTSGLSLVPKDRIFHPAPNTSFFGKFYADFNLVAVNFANLISFAQKNPVLDSDLILLHCLCHEQAHAVSGVEFDIPEGEYAPEDHLDEYGNPKTVSSDARIGYAVGAYDMTNVRFRLFNESITERLSRAVMREYVGRTGFMDEKRFKDFLVYYITNPDKIPYGHAVGLLECIVAHASVAFGVRKAELWSNLVRGFCTTGDLSRLNPDRDWNGVFGDGFLEELSKLRDSQDIESIKAWIVTGNKI